MVRSLGSCARVLGLLAVLALAAGPVWAGPYDSPYGVQWNFIIGHAGSDTPYRCVASPDGTVWIGTMGAGNSSGSPALTWGNPTGVYGGSYASGYGQISPTGRILQGNDFPAVPGLTNYSQGYSPSISFVPGDATATAYISVNVNSAALWSDASPADTSGHSGAVSFSVTSLAGTPGVDYDGTPSVTLPINNAAGLDPTNKFTFDMVSTTYYNGSAHQSVMGSDGSYYIATGNQGSDPFNPPDMFTAGEFSGPYSQSYKPTVGRVSADGLTLYGPTNQPSCGGRSFYNKIDLNESAGKVYAAGYGYNGSGGTMTDFDPDGPGPAATVTFNTALPGASDRGFAAVYDSTSWAVQKTVTWESSHGGELRIYDITATPDGGFVVCGYTSGDMSGTNPSPGTRDGYIEKYKADGSLDWSYQSQTAYYEYFGSARPDADGNIYVAGSQDTPAGNRDPILLKFEPDGTLAWTSIVDNAGTVESVQDAGGIDKTAQYLISAHDPSAGGTPWTNSISYVAQGSNENLLQKLSPGDFNTDGFTQWDDLNLMIAAVGGGLPGDDTYDFDEDGDSDSDDVDFFMEKIFNSHFGDFNWDGIKGDQGDYDLLGGWQPGDSPMPLPAGWRGFAGPLTPNEIDLEEWLYLNEPGGPDDGVIPEPATMALLGLAACGLGGYVRRRRKA